MCAGAIHAGYKNEAILGYAYDFNERWRVQVDWQSGSENSSTIGFTCNVTPDFQFNPALYVNNGPNHDLFGYIVFTYTFHVWGKKEHAGASKTHRPRCRRKIMSEKPKSPRSRISAGLLMFRRRNDEIEVLLAHPGGPFFVRKDDGVWTIPKGEAAPGEDLLTRAQIEFEEEVGFRPENVRTMD